MIALTLDQALHSIFHYIEDSFIISPSFTFHLPHIEDSFSISPSFIYIVEDGMQSLG
jgi:hypothetical protein